MSHLELSGYVRGDAPTYEGDDAGGSKRVEAMNAEAKRRGCVVIAPTPLDLFVDIDDEPSAETFWRVMKRLRLTGAAQSAPSPSGMPHRFHVVLTLTTAVTPLERIGLQLLLGSDRTREEISAHRHLRGVPLPTVFYEKAPDDAK